jgi:glycerol-3-phosphate dehydrogenase
MHDHGRHGGPRGVFSLSGVKYTTARRVAADALAMAWRNRGGLPDYGGVPRPRPSADVAFNDARWPLDTPSAQVTAALRRIVDDEAVQALDDLLLRRTDWLVDPVRGDSVAAEVRRLLDRALPGDTTMTETTQAWEG